MLARGARCHNTALSHCCTPTHHIPVAQLSFTRTLQGPLPSTLLKPSKSATTLGETEKGKKKRTGKQKVLHSNEENEVVQRSRTRKKSGQFLLSVDPAVKNCAFVVLDVTKTVVFMEKVAFSGKNSQTWMAKIVKYCHSLYTEYKVQDVVIEAQFTGKAKLVSAVILSFFETMRTVHNSQSKVGVHLIPAYKNKSLAVKKAVELEPDFKFLKGKKDDFADAYLQGIYALDVFFKGKEALL